VTSHAPAYPTFERVAREPALFLKVLAAVTVPGFVSALAIAGGPPGMDTGADTGPTDTGPTDTGPTDTGADTGPTDTGVDTGGAVQEVTTEEARAFVVVALREHACVVSPKDAFVSLQGGGETLALAADCGGLGGGLEIRVAITPDDEAMEMFTDRPAIWVGWNVCTLFEDDGECRLADCTGSHGGPDSPAACGRYVDLPSGAWSGPEVDRFTLYDQAIERLLWTWWGRGGRLVGCGCEAAPLDVQAVWVLLAAGLATLRRRRP
jgi:hypothetical protein